MAIPLRKIVAPAMAWVYFSNFPNGIKLNPNEASKTMTNMVAIVIPENSKAMEINPQTPLIACPSIMMGIKGSQGPKTKMVKSIQGVILGLWV